MPAAAVVGGAKAPAAAGAAAAEKAPEEKQSIDKCFDLFSTPEQLAPEDAWSVARPRSKTMAVRLMTDDASQVLRQVQAARGGDQDDGALVGARR